MYIRQLGNHYMMSIIKKEDEITFHSPSKGGISWFIKTIGSK
jgi:hypothetical protein